MIDLDSAQVVAMRHASSSSFPFLFLCRPWEVGVGPTDTGEAGSRVAVKSDTRPQAMTKRHLSPGGPAMGTDGTGGY